MDRAELIDFAKKVITELEKRPRFPKGSILMHEYQLPGKNNFLITLEGNGYQAVNVNRIYKAYQKDQWTWAMVLDVIAMELSEEPEVLPLEPPKDINLQTVRAELVNQANPSVQEQWVIKQSLFDMALYFYYEGTGEFWEELEDRIERRDMEHSNFTEHDLFLAAMDNLIYQMVQIKKEGLALYHLDNATALLSPKLSSHPGLEHGCYVYPHQIDSVYLITVQDLRKKFPSDKEQEAWLAMAEGRLETENKKQKNAKLILSSWLYWYEGGTLTKLKNGRKTKEKKKLKDLI